MCYLNIIVKIITYVQTLCSGKGLQYKNCRLFFLYQVNFEFCPHFAKPIQITLFSNTFHLSYHILVIRYFITHVIHYYNLILKEMWFLLYERNITIKKLPLFLNQSKNYFSGPIMPRVNECLAAKQVEPTTPTPGKSSPCRFGCASFCVGPQCAGFVT